jgi:hypothetical protein
MIFFFFNHPEDTKHTKKKSVCTHGAQFIIMARKIGPRQLFFFSAPSFTFFSIPMCAACVMGHLRQSSLSAANEVTPYYIYKPLTSLFYGHPEELPSEPVNRKKTRSFVGTPTKFNTSQYYIRHIVNVYVHANSDYVVHLNIFFSFIIMIRTNNIICMAVHK